MSASKPHSELRAKIVAALNLTPLVPPQADTETLNVVDDAWSALSDLMRLVEQLETLREAATALYERVEMDESVGVCLSSRIESLNLGVVLDSNPAGENVRLGEQVGALRQVVLDCIEEIEDLAPEGYESWARIEADRVLAEASSPASEPEEGA